MATLSAISKFLACYTWGRKGEGQERGGSGITSWDNTFFSPILIWNGVNSQSKSNKLQNENKNRYDETERHRGNIDPPKINNDNNIK